MGRLYRATTSRIREWRLPGLLRQLQRAPPSAAAIMPIVARLREAWGNTGWSADLGAVEEVVTRALRSPGPFLECGAGFSTLLLGVIARRNGTTVWSLEQDAEWSLTMRRRLAAAGLHNVQLLYAPLEVTDGGAWYRCDDDAIPRAFPLVFCDGPAVLKSQWPEAVYLVWRSRLVAELTRRSIAFGTIVLDDAEDARCGRLVDAWRSAGLQTEIVATPFGRHVVASQPLMAPASGNQRA